MLSDLIQLCKEKPTTAMIAGLLFVIAVLVSLGYRENTASNHNLRTDLQRIENKVDGVHGQLTAGAVNDSIVIMHLRGIRKEVDELKGRVKKLEDER